MKPLGHCSATSSTINGESTKHRTHHTVASLPNPIKTSTVVVESHSGRSSYKSIPQVQTSPAAKQHSQNPKYRLPPAGVA
ncbi:hypothetical protein NXY56_002293 [Leishmania guyanensis]